MDIRDGFVGSIGNTPLIRLRQASERTGCEILGKAEFLNPGGSVKDRAALYMILADSGTRYQSKLFNRAFLTEKGLPCPDWL